RQEADDNKSDADSNGAYYDDESTAVSDSTPLSTTFSLSTENSFDKAKQHAEEALKLAKKLPSMYGY
ncbi:unnamed protein product, partial [Didymodactylos carnosus]